MNEVKIAFGMVICVLAFVFFMAWFEASQEAKAFNKFKSPETPAATLWDAIFIELRVEAR